MDIHELLSSIFQVVIIPLLTVLTGYLIKWINAKANEIKNTTENETLQKYITMLNNTITTAVIAVNQTYVDELKEKDAFTKEAQEAAFQKVLDTVEATLTDEALIYLQTAIEDLKAYIAAKIEEQVKLNKLPK